MCPVDEHLLTIGEFARRSRLSLKALRLYERLGLLNPAVVDPANGYRRYREEQLFTARLIVNEDSDGPVEVAIPVRTGSAATRREPAHRQAYVAVTRAQWEWPQILSAYDAVEKWIHRHGRSCIGSPRENLPGRIRSGPRGRDR